MGNGGLGMCDETERTDTREEVVCRELQRRADEITSLVIASDLPAIDVVIRICRLKEFVEAHMPGRTALFERIYGSRFRRLWDQFRAKSEGALPEW